MSATFLIVEPIVKGSLEPIAPITFPWVPHGAVVAKETPKGAQRLLVLYPGSWDVTQQVRYIVVVSQTKLMPSYTVPWRHDQKCGPNNPNSAGNPAECDPSSSSPCCSGSWCGDTALHCTCPGCTDYRTTGGDCVTNAEHEIVRTSFYGHFQGERRGVLMMVMWLQSYRALENPQTALTCN